MPNGKQRTLSAFRPYYTRHQIIAIQEKENAANEKAKRQFSIAMLLLVVAVASYIIYKMYAEKKRKQAQYIRNLEELEQTQTEVLQLRAHAEEYEELIAKKEELLEEQNAKLQEQRKKSLQDHAASDKHIKTSDIYQVLQNNTSSMQKTSMFVSCSVWDLSPKKLAICLTLPKAGYPKYVQRY